MGNKDRFRPNARPSAAKASAALMIDKLFDHIDCDTHFTEVGDASSSQIV
jgi:hypothetical protein